MLMPKEYNWSIWRGNTRIIRVDVPINLTGYTAGLCYMSSGKVVTIPMSISQSTDQGYYSISVELSPAITSSFTQNSQKQYEIQIKSADGKQYSILYGILKFIGGINN